MKEIYSWVPWFRELAKKIATGGEAYLSEKANDVEWGKSRALLKYGDENIDPFSFFYFLAGKNTNNQRAPVYRSVHKVFDIVCKPPKTGGRDTFIIPTPPGQATLFHDGKNFDPTILWRLFRQAVKDKPDIQAQDFQAALKINKVGVAKLSQCLFLINPRCFIPIDKCFPGQQAIENQIKGQDGWNICERAFDRTKQDFPGCYFYEIGRVYYLLWSQLITLRQNFFQISTNTFGYGNDHWHDFEENNWVYTWGAGSHLSWEKESEGKYPLAQPELGDIILVRTGSTTGRAIGIVEKNDYAEPDGLNENSRIHVLWINKSKNQLSGRTVQDGFSDVKPDSGTYQAFKNTASYKPTFDFIESWMRNSIEEGTEPYPASLEQETDIMKHPLNQILYGPPGTSKTWDTVNHAVAIIDDQSVDGLKKEDRKKIKQRFDELRDNGRIEMVTFHQNYTYEDFIEGIRPVLDSDEGSGNIKYELSKGVFRKIAKQAEENREQHYVLIIDEINRGNIAKIFGELITLIEPSKRLGRDDAATVTLPYSKKSFGVPNNLYMIDAMNTADRSIALLDTALRRRFEFIEMMPDPEHPGVSEDIEGVNCQKLLNAMNKRISVLLDREHQVGHTYFMETDNMASLQKTFKNQIIPLLQEYFYDNWEKIDLVLNRNSFINEKTVDEILFQRSDSVDTNHNIYELLPADDDKWQQPESYKNIYEPENQQIQDEPNNQAS